MQVSVKKAALRIINMTYHFGWKVEIRGHPCFAADYRLKGQRSRFLSSLKETEIVHCGSDRYVQAGSSRCESIMALSQSCRLKPARSVSSAAPSSSKIVLLSYLAPALFRPQCAITMHDADCGFPLILFTRISLADTMATALLRGALTSTSTTTSTSTCAS